MSDSTHSILRWVADPPFVAVGSEVMADEAIVLRTMANDMVAQGLVNALTRGLSEEEGADFFVDEGLAGIAAWYHLLEVLVDAGRLTPLLGEGGSVLLLRRAAGDTTVYSGHPRVGDESLVIAAESFVSRQGERWRIECPTSRAVAELAPELMSSLVSGEGADATALALLREAGILVATDAVHSDLWPHHDRYFHWRTRRGGHPYVVGATYPLREEMPPLPVVEAPVHGEVFDIAALAGDPADTLAAPLADVLARRRSHRHGSRALTLRELADFCLAHRALEVVEVSDNVEYPQSRRLYPGGGAGYEIDLYLTTRGVGALPAGVWWFDAVDPRLCRVSGDEADVEAVFADAMIATGGAGLPDVLVTYALRMGRNSWKYEGMAYRLALLDAGVLYGHAYTVGSALGIGVCGLGNGDSGVLASILGGDPWQVVSVAEVMLSGAP